MAGGGAEGPQALPPWPAGALEVDGGSLPRGGSGGVVLPPPPPCLPFTKADGTEGAATGAGGDNPGSGQGVDSGVRAGAASTDDAQQQSSADPGPTTGQPKEPPADAPYRSRRPSLQKVVDEEESFEVMKVKQLGLRYSRTLRLGRETLEEVKPGPAVRSFLYRELAGIHLVKANRFVLNILQEGAFTYDSPMAPQIVEKILARSRQSAARPVALSAEELKRLANSIAHQTLEQARKSVAARQKQEEEEEERRRAKEMGTAVGARRASKLQRMTGESEVERIVIHVRKIVYDEATVEGQSRAHFLSTYDAAQGLEPLRRYIDAFWLHVMNTRREELQRLTIQTKIEEDAFSQRPSRVAVSLSSLAAEPMPEAEQTVSAIVMQVVEEAVLAPMMERVERWLRTEAGSKGEERELVLKMEYLRLYHNDQAFFSVQPDLISPKQWADAVQRLASIEQAPASSLPTAKLHLLLESIKAIYVEHTLNCQRQHEQRQREQHEAAGTSEGLVLRPLALEEVEPLGGDDLMPIVIYVVCMAGLTAPMTLSTLLWGLCSADTLRGEGGYYLTMYEAALEFIKDLCLDHEPEFAKRDHSRRPSTLLPFTALSSPAPSGSQGTSSAGASAGSNGRLQRLSNDMLRRLSSP